jgi:hypothetical protein
MPPLQGFVTLADERVSEVAAYLAARLGWTGSADVYLVLGTLWVEESAQSVVQS